MLDPIIRQPQATTSCSISVAPAIVAMIVCKVFPLFPFFFPFRCVTTPSVPRRRLCMAAAKNDPTAPFVSVRRDLRTGSGCALPMDMVCCTPNFFFIRLNNLLCCRDSGGFFFLPLPSPNELDGPHLPRIRSSGGHTHPNFVTAQ